MGYSPRDSKESDMTERLHFTHYRTLAGLGYFQIIWASLVAHRLKRLPPIQETRVRSLSREDLLEKEMVTHSSILAWRIPWTEKPGGVQSMGLQRVEHDFTFTFFGIGMQMTFFTPVSTAEFSKFAGKLSAALSQHHLLGFEIAQLEFHHLH